MIKQAIEAAPFDKTYRGRVMESSNSACSVLINGSIIEIKTDTTYTIGDYVNILMPRNDWKKPVILGSGYGSSDEIDEVSNKVDAVSDAVTAETARAKAAEAAINDELNGVSDLLSQI